MDYSSAMPRGASGTRSKSAVESADGTAFVMMAKPGHPTPITDSALTANIVADLLISFCNEHGDLLTNLRLQRILYYAQAWHLALHNKKLFPEDFEAREIGPIQPDVYQRFLPFGNSPIQQTQDMWRPSTRIAKHIGEVMKAYGHLSAFDLELIAREEEPWKAAKLKAKQGKGATISTKVMQKFYKLRLHGQEE